MSSNHNDSSLDLPAAMFRTGDESEEAFATMNKNSADTVVNVAVQFTDVDGLALFQGDIVLGTAAQARGDEDRGDKGLGIVGEEFRWPDGKVPFVTVEPLSELVANAIAHWQERTPFTFVPRTNEEDFVSFEQQGGCFSNVGRQGGPQVISLGDGCGLGSAIHEIGHTIGLWHEQGRSDRDDFIEIFLENVKPSARHNFDKHIQDGIDLGAYDFGSIMHYPEKAFSINGQVTIRTKDGQSIGQRNGLSAGDIQAVKLLYPNLDWSAFP